MTQAQKIKWQRERAVTLDLQHTDEQIGTETNMRERPSIQTKSMAWCTVKQKKSQVQQNPRPHEKAIVSDTGKPENKIKYTQEQEKALRKSLSWK